MVEYKIRIETKKEKVYYSDFVFTTGDVRAYKFIFDFTDIDAAECSLGVKAKRADGTVVIGKSSDCKSFIVPGNMYSVPGEVLFEVALYDATGGCITTKVVAATVRKGFGEDGLTADDRYPILTSLINETGSTKALLNGILDNNGKINTEKLADESVDKEKLSAELQTLLQALEDFKDENHAPADAEKNVQVDWLQDDEEADSYIRNKPIVDAEISAESENAVQNKTVKEYVDTSVQSAVLDSWEVAV